MHLLDVPHVVMLCLVHFTLPKQAIAQIDKSHVGLCTRRVSTSNGCPLCLLVAPCALHTNQVCVAHAREFEQSLDARHAGHRGIVLLHNLGSLLAHTAKHLVAN